MPSNLLNTFASTVTPMGPNPGGFLGLFGGDDDEYTPRQSDLGQIFAGNPFRSFDYAGNLINNVGTPIFDPNTGQFVGLRQQNGSVTQPRARISTAERQGQALTRSLIQNLPSLGALINAQIMPGERAQVEASQYSSPIYAALAREIARQNATSESGTTLDLLRGTGGDIVREQDALAREIDPEYYRTRTATSGAVNDLLKPGLTGGEREEIQRYLNQEDVRSGNINAPSRVNTVGNAMTFGNAARNRLSQAVTQATQAMPTFRSGVDVLQAATNRSSAIPTGFQQGSGSNQFGLGQGAAGIFGNLTGGAMSNTTQQNIAQMQQPDTFDRVTQALGAVNY